MIYKLEFPKNIICSTKVGLNSNLTLDKMKDAIQNNNIKNIPIRKSCLIIDLKSDSPIKHHELNINPKENSNNIAIKIFIFYNKNFYESWIYFRFKPRLSNITNPNSYYFIYQSKPKPYFQGQQDSTYIIKEYKLILHESIDTLSLRKKVIELLGLQNLSQSNQPQTKRSVPLPQLILQGPPGTGKSHRLDARLNEYGIDQDSDRFERVIGHPELTSADFIGQYRPMTKGVDKELEYCFVPGPFTRLLKQALGDREQAYILIIEELNRTNAAAMFAEVFQLLDRRDDGQSQYGVNLGTDVNRYLLKKEDEEDPDDYEERISRHKVRLPANFAIWATMNTADQGVFPMDTAFKRRWSFEYLGVNEGEEVWGKADPQKPNPWNPMIMDDGSIGWQSLRKGINQVLSLHGKDEDRQLGGFFLTQRELGWDPIKNCLADNHLKIIQQNIMTKVIGYLRDDVLRYEPHVLFNTNEQKAVLGFSGLITQMKREGILSVFRASDVKTWKTEFQEYIARHQSVNPTIAESESDLTEETQEEIPKDTQPDTQQEQQNPADSDDEDQD